MFARDLGWSVFQCVAVPHGRSEERNGRQRGSACRWPQVLHTQAIRLRPMTLFNPVFNCLTPIVIKRSKTQADEGLTTADEAGYVFLRQPQASKLANLDARERTVFTRSQSGSGAMFCAGHGRIASKGSIA